MEEVAGVRGRTARGVLLDGSSYGGRGVGGFGETNRDARVEEVAGVEGETARGDLLDGSSCGGKGVGGRVERVDGAFVDLFLKLLS